MEPKNRTLEEVGPLIGCAVTMLAYVLMAGALLNDAVALTAGFVR